MAMSARGPGCGMDKRQKSALRSSHTLLADELILDEDFYAALRQHKIFTDGMLGIIKNERKDRSKVYKMLELLEKRGPDAFSNFVSVLRINFSWLADMLQDEYTKKRLHVQPVGSGQHEETNVKGVQASPQVTSCSSCEQTPLSGRFTFNPNSQVTYQGQHSYHPGCQVCCTGQRHHCFEPSQNPWPTDQSGQMATDYQRQLTKNCSGQVATNFPGHMFTSKLPQGMNIQSPNESDSQVGQEISQPSSQTFLYQHHQDRSSGHQDHSLKNSQADNYPREYKDACMSPIEVIETSRKPKRSSSARASSKATDYNDKKITDDLVRNQTKISFNEDKNKQSSDKNEGNLPGGQRARLKQFDHADGYGSLGKNEFDDSINDAEGDDDDTVFLTSEEFYNDVRRSSMGTSEYQDEILQTDEFFQDIDTSNSVSRYNEDHESNYTRSESGLSSTHVLDTYIQPMCELYEKLVNLNGVNASENNLEPKQPENAEEITWEMIHDEVDKVAQQLRDSDDSKMIQECYNLFPERERRKPLNTCVHSLQSEMKDLKKINNEKSKEIERMAQDMYNHFKEMNDIKRMKQTIYSYQDEIKTIKAEKEILEKKLEEKGSLIHELERKNQHLQSKFARDPSPEKEKVPSPRKTTALVSKGSKAAVSKARGSGYMAMGGTRTALYSKSTFNFSPRTATGAHYPLRPSKR